MKLCITGGTHLLSNVDSRIATVEEKIDSVDAIFIETRGWDDIQLRTKFINYVSSPFLLLVVRAWEALVGVLSPIFQGDQNISNRLSEKYNAPIYEVDRPIHRIIQDQRYLWFLSNWGLITPPAVIVYVGWRTQIAYFGFLFLLINIISLFAAFVAGTMTERNIHMLDRMDSLSDEYDIQNACLVTGGSHVDQLSTLARLFDSITIVGADDESFLPF